MVVLSYSGGENVYRRWRVYGHVGCVPRQALECFGRQAGTSVSRKARLFCSVRMTGIYE